MRGDPPASPWTQPGTVAGFAQSPPNDVLMQFASDERARAPDGLIIDIGCGAGRNAVPLAEHGWRVVGTDVSWPMLEAAAARAAGAEVADRVSLVAATMDQLPLGDRCAELVIAHGIWNLARSSAEFRRGVEEAARVAKPRAGLFVFTFSRHTLPISVTPVAGESFVFTEFSGQPQCFLTEDQLIEQLGVRGFVRDPTVPLREYNRPGPNAVAVGRVPVIYEAAFRYRP